MGYLHDGHLSLIDHASSQSDAVVVSIFINPIQFGPAEDLASYPRDLERDRAAARQRGADCLFVPSTTAMYNSDPVVRVGPGSLASHLCGPYRPGHFEGVLTVVAKLFHMVEPDVAVFGRKDFQQALVITRMVQDLSFPVRVFVAPTVREPDGLAMSSRNSYLAPTERTAAVRIPQGLEAAHRAFRAGVSRTRELVAEVRAILETEPLLRIEYLEAVDPNTLEQVDLATGQTVLAVAVRIGSARLIDNVLLADGISAGDSPE
jgi:pantoate--beta-alanine ligase